MATQSANAVRIDVFKNDIVQRLFIDAADEDYVLARLSYHKSMYEGFFWAAHLYNQLPSDIGKDRGLLRPVKLSDAQQQLVAGTTQCSRDLVRLSEFAPRHLRDRAAQQWFQPPRSTTPIISETLLPLADRRS